MIPFLALGKVKIALYAAAAAAVIAIIGLLWWQNRSMNEEIERLAEERGKLVLATKAQGDTIKSALRNAQEWAATMATLQETMNKATVAHAAATSEMRRLNDIFAKHDLSKLALKKPGLIERRIDAGSNASLRVLENITAGNIDGSGKTGSSAGKASAP
jgi:hypothetical protein